MIVVLTYGLLWTLTATWGEADVYTDAFGLIDPKSVRVHLAEDPVSSDDCAFINAHLPAKHWHAVTTFSPTPFLLRVRLSVGYADVSGFTQGYWVLWFFGWRSTVSRCGRSFSWD
jgi:hypothetical protein